MGNILIIKLSALGDIAVASPHINSICDHYKKDNIFLVTEFIGSTLFQAHPRINVIILNRKQWFGKNCIRSVIKKIKTKKITVAYDLQGNRISRKIIKTINSPISVGTQPENCYSHHPDEIYTKKMETSVFDRLNETLISGGLPPVKPFGNIYLDDKSKKHVAYFVKQAGIENNRFFCIHAGSANGWPSKRWPKESFIWIAKKIEDAGIKVIWIGAKEDEDVNNWLSNQVGINATLRLSPLEVCGLAKNAIGALGNDSGPMHLFATANIPVFGFFGPTDPSRSHGLGQKKRVIYNNSPCSPCYSGKCKKGKKHMCLANISPLSVWDKITSEIDFGY